jgi:hypothetical protein
MNCISPRGTAPHARDRGRRGAEAVATVHVQDHALGLAVRQKSSDPVERRIAAAEDHQALAGELAALRTR